MYGDVSPTQIRCYCTRHTSARVGVIARKGEGGSRGLSLMLLLPARDCIYLTPVKHSHGWSVAQAAAVQGVAIETLLQGLLASCLV